MSGAHKQALEEVTMLGTLDSAGVESLLHEQVVGRIGCHAGGRTYVVPSSYVYDGTAIYGHSALGQKIAMMRENPEVCFEIDRYENLSNWQSVVVNGRFEELHGEAAHAALHTLMQRFRALAPDSPTPPTHGEHVHPVIFRIVPVDKSGRFERT